MEKIISGLNKAINDDIEKERKVDQLADYMRVRIKETRYHQIWAVKFFLCECLNFINVILQIIITDKFLGGEFSKYGTEVRVLK